jgi:dihydrofolate synthase/folylpolyglutamate synthase
MRESTMRQRKSLDYKTALEQLYSLDKFGSKMGLDRIREMLSGFGNPQQSFACVLVGGSNGKGSTVEMVGSILRCSGFCTGTYFSPQVVEFPERIRVNGKGASHKEIAWAYSRVREVCSSYNIQATFFEVVTAMAMLIFERRKVAYAVLEVGLGGRLDATNAAEPELSVISSLSLEHTDVLGPTLSHIAHEKCGIARKEKKLVCGVINEEAKRAVISECSAIGARTVMVEDEMRLTEIRQNGMSYSFVAKYEGEEFKVDLSAPGRFQISNACIALAAGKELGAERKAIEKGLSRAKPPYRMQKVGSAPLTIADCCHNPEAAFAISAEVERLPPKRKVLLFSAMQDKDYPQMLRVLRAHFDAVVLCQVSLSRAATLSSLEAAAKKDGLSLIGASDPLEAAQKAEKTEGTVAFSIKKPARALQFARFIAGRNGYVFIAGSIYLLAELYGKDKIRIAQ